MKRMVGVAMCVWLGLMGLTSSGCVPTVAAVVAYKATQNKTQNQYRDYVAGMEKTNQERIDRGLAPMPIKSFEEWKR